MRTEGHILFFPVVRLVLFRIGFFLWANINNNNWGISRIERVKKILTID